MKTFEGIGNTLQEKLDWGILVEETYNSVKEVIYMNAENEYYIYKVYFDNLFVNVPHDYNISAQDIMDYTKIKILDNFWKLPKPKQLEALIAVLGKKTMLGYPEYTTPFTLKQIEAYILKELA